MDERHTMLLDYVVGSMNGGYTEEQVKKSLIEHNIPLGEIGLLFAEAKAEINSKKLTESNMLPHATHHIAALFVVMGGIVAMAVTYIYIIKPEGTVGFSSETILNSLWPLAFPAASNLLNLIFFRKKFLFGLFLSLVIMAVLALLFFGLSMLAPA